MYQKLLSYLAALGIALGGSQAAAVPAYLEEIPDDLLTDLVDDLDADELQDLDRVRLSEVLAEDPRSQVRKLAARLTGDIKDPKLRLRAEILLKKLTRDTCSSVRSDAIIALSHLIQTMGPLECNSLVCSWATSEHTDQRMALASALSMVEQVHPGSSSFTELALEHLAADHAWRVRAAVAKASSARMYENPDLYQELLRGLESDPARPVRRIAKKGLQNKNLV